MATVPNKLAGACRCGVRLEPGQGLWSQELRHLRCVACHRQDLETAAAGAISRPSVHLVPFAERPKVRLYYNVNTKRAVGKALDMTEAPFAAFRDACETSGLVWQDGHFVGRLELVPETIRLLDQAGLTLEVSDNLADALLERAARIREAVAAAGVRGLAAGKEGRQLRDYQLVGVEFIVSRDAMILGDDMGCGKSAQILRAAPVRPRLLIIAPKIMRGSMVDGKPMGGWADEIKLWRPDIAKITIIDEEADFRWPEKNEAVLVNYERLPAAPDEYAKKREKNLKKIAKAREEGLPPPSAEDLEVERMPTAPPAPPDVEVVVDEAHRLCDPKSLQTRRVHRLILLALAAGGRVRGVTATPLKNDAPELWTILDVFTIAQRAFGSYRKFEVLHNHRSETLPNGKTKAIWGKPEPEIAERLKRVFLRRRKRDVLTELPPITIRKLVVDIDEDEVLKACDKAYSEIEKSGLSFDEALAIVEETKKAKIDITTISKAVSALAKVKAPFAIDLAKEREAAGVPTVIFSAHVPLVEQLGRRTGWGALLGGDKCTLNLDGKPRKVSDAEVVAAFQAGKLKGGACTIQKAGVGINLTYAWDAIMAGQLWSQVLNDQAIARIDRFGQQNPMTVTILTTRHPLDIRMTEVLERKIALFTDAVDAAAVPPEDLGKRQDVAMDLIEAAARRVSRAS